MTNENLKKLSQKKDNKMGLETFGKKYKIGLTYKGIMLKA